jgi:hypothetical protein
MVDQLAQVEAILALCDTTQAYDQRLQEEVRACIKTESIDRTQSFSNSESRPTNKYLSPLCVPSRNCAKSFQISKTR